jgi:hypothetical protein
MSANRRSSVVFPMPPYPRTPYQNHIGIVGAVVDLAGCFCQHPPESVLLLAAPHEQAHDRPPSVPPGNPGKRQSTNPHLHCPGQGWRPAASGRTG